MLQTHKISKSLYIRGIQCIKSLYLHKNRPFLRDRLKAEQRAKFERGHAIGILAHQLFPGGLNLAPKSPSQYKQAVIKTAEAIAAGTKIIYEASFQHQQSLIILDILQKKDDNRVGRGITLPPSHTTVRTLVYGGFKLILNFS
ncbi:MAG TPA: hypothetical protein PLS41_02700 [Bacteroidales bacterium]|nr:hypothetical protein [Bacteroidales bacterium]